MRFIRRERLPFVETPRKRAAVLVSQRQMREKYPLLGPLIAETQPSVDEVMQSRAVFWEEHEAAERRERAARWWDARASIKELAEPDRTIFRRWWNAHRWYPADPGYLKASLHCLKTGRLVIVGDTIRPRSEIEAEAKRDAAIAAMTDAELDHMIQTHWSMMIVELGRAERLRRESCRLAEDQAP